MNAQSNALEYAFKRNGIPYRIIGGTRFFDSGGESENSRHIFGARSHRIFLTASDDVRYELLRLENIVSYPQRADALQCADFVRACRYHIDTELSR